MSIFSPARALVKAWLYRPGVNAVLGRAVRSAAPLLPRRVAFRFPLVGVKECPLPGGRTLKLYSHGDDGIVPKLYFGGFDRYEPETTAVVRRLLADVRVMIDIGANTGVFSLLAAHLQPEARIYAFEPVPKVCERLQKNVGLNPEARITVVQQAASESDGEITIYIPASQMPTSSSTRADFRKAVEEVVVQTTKLDSFVQSEAIERVDLLKIDTEGTEPKVLAGAQELLARDRPAIICEVLKGLTESDLHAALDPLGYRYFWITERGLVPRERIAGDPTWEYLNYLFLTARDVPRVANMIVA